MDCNFLPLQKGKGAEVVLECLVVLIRMTKMEQATKMLQYSGLARNLWIPICKFATPESVDPSWNQVYILCVHLNSKLLESQTHYYIEECFNFWGLHGMFLCHKLWSLSEMVENFLLNSPDTNYRSMKELLNFDVFILNAVSAMIPYLDGWRIQQPTELPRIIVSEIYFLNYFTP